MSKCSASLERTFRLCGKIQTLLVHGAAGSSLRLASAAWKAAIDCSCICMPANSYVQVPPLSSVWTTVFSESVCLKVAQYTYMKSLALRMLRLTVAPRDMLRLPAAAPSGPLAGTISGPPNGGEPRVLRNHPIFCCHIAFIQSIAHLSLHSKSAMAQACSRPVITGTVASTVQAWSSGEAMARYKSVFRRSQHLLGGFEGWCDAPALANSGLREYGSAARLPDGCHLTVLGVQPAADWSVEPLTACWILARSCTSGSAPLRSLTVSAASWPTLAQSTGTAGIILNGRTSRAAGDKSSTTTSITF